MLYLFVFYRTLIDATCITTILGLVYKKLGLTGPMLIAVSCGVFMGFKTSAFIALSFSFCTFVYSDIAFALDTGLTVPISLGEISELFDCNTGESLGVQEINEAAIVNACFAPACAKHTFTDEFGIKWDYCDGACSEGRVCTATYRDPQNPGKGIKRCSCKPTNPS